MNAALKGSVLITRPEADAIEVADEIDARGYHAICQPFLKIEYCNFTVPDLDAYVGLIVTSTNALRALSQFSIPNDIKVVAVGDRTTTEAIAMGFQNVQSASGTVEDLATLIKAGQQDKPYLYIRGKEVSQDLKSLVAPVCVDEIIAYHADIIEEIEPLVEKILMRGEMGHVLFFSKRTAESFVTWLKNHEQGLSIAAGLKHSTALCLGDSMVECLSNIQWKDIQVAHAPNRQSMMTLLS